MTKTNTSLSSLSSPLILSGTDVSNTIQKKIKSEIEEIRNKNKRVPGLAVILVGDNPASSIYVKSKEKACLNAGMHSEVHKLPSNISEQELIQLIESLNNDKKIDGILLQLPLPPHIKSEYIIKHINPNKDIDGLHPINLGKLLSGQDCLKPCTPLGVIELLKHYSINLNGMSAVVIGRSTLVGKPLGLLLLQENATVTIAHSKTHNLNEVSRNADLVISAIGNPRFIKKTWIKKNAIVIDVGINRIPENDKSILCGDVDFEDVKSVCHAITPVPGGIGPMTIAMLISNTVKAYKMNE